MKLLHLSDLHLGKRVNEFSMLEDQRYILTQILLIIDEERPDAVLISGDIYDRTVPPAEAVQRSSTGDFVYLIKPDNTVTLREVVQGGQVDEA